MMNPYRRAIGIIKRRGWNQGSALNGAGEVCIAEAVEMGGQRRAVFDPILRRAVQTVTPFPSWAGPVPAWNDAPERTIEDVYLALKHAAADWDAEHGSEGA